MRIGLRVVIFWATVKSDTSDFLSTTLMNVSRRMSGWFFIFRAFLVDTDNHEVEGDAYSHYISSGSDINSTALRQLTREYGYGCEGVYEPGHSDDLDGCLEARVGLSSENPDSGSGFVVGRKSAGRVDGSADFFVYLIYSVDYAGCCVDIQTHGERPKDTRKRVLQSNVELLYRRVEVEDKRPYSGSCANDP